MLTIENFKTLRDTENVILEKIVRLFKISDRYGQYLKIKFRLLTAQENGVWSTRSIAVSFFVIKDRKRLFDS